MAGLGLEPPTFRSEVQRANHYTTSPFNPFTPKVAKAKIHQKF